MFNGLIWTDFNEYATYKILEKTLVARSILNHILENNSPIESIILENKHPLVSMCMWAIHLSFSFST